VPPQLIALLSAFSYSFCIILARSGMRYTTPITVTYVSLVVHTVTLWSAVFLTGGVPAVAPAALGLFVIAGMLQTLIRLFTYTGLQKIGASRGYTLRSTSPIFSALIAVAFLGEEVTLAIVLGTALVVAGSMFISWQPEGDLTAFRWTDLFFPLAASLLAGAVQPIRRSGLMTSNEPLFFAALVGLVALICFVGFLALPSTKERLVWNRQSLPAVVATGGFETLGILLGIMALSSGTVVLVTPISTTSMLWVMLWSALFLRDIERINSRTVVGGCCVVAGVIAISV
jgi:uncharacterized membrane protein